MTIFLDQYKLLLVPQNNGHSHKKQSLNGQTDRQTLLWYLTGTWWRITLKRKQVPGKPKGDTSLKRRSTAAALLSVYTP